jgi:2-oxoglutarate dehydrogenase E1 component
MKSPHHIHERLNEALVSMGANAAFVEELFHDYLNNPASVAESWRDFFAQISNDLSGNGGNDSAALARIKNSTATPPTSKTMPALQLASAEREAAAPIRGVAAKIVQNMEASLTLPLASSQRLIPVKVIDENRRVINQHLEVTGKGKVSYTHLIGWAIVQTLKEFSNMNSAFAEIDSEPHRLERPQVNLGIAVDVERKDGTRALLVPNLKNAQAMNFREYLTKFDELIAKSRAGTIDPSDFQGTTISLTNPGTVGTVASMPRLMPGQGTIIATGSIDYPAEFSGMDARTLATLGVSKVMMISSTYDHRIIQGAESGMFLGKIHKLLLGEENFFDQIFADLKIPYHPVRWTQDRNTALFGGMANREETEKQARVLQLIHAYRVRGHLVADLDPLGREPQYHPELDPNTYGLSIWDLDREFITGGFGRDTIYRVPTATLREILETVRQTYCAKIGVEYMHIQDTDQKQWLQDRMEPTRNRSQFSIDVKKQILAMLIAAEAFEKFLHTKFVGHKRFSVEGGETAIAILHQLLEEAAAQGVEEVVIGMAHRGRLNVLTNIIGKSYAQVFSEFEGNIDPQSIQGSGDVKYHMTASGVRSTRSGKEIKVSVMPNPSHLEAVNPVVEGVVRAKQTRIGDANRTRVLPVLLHGDAAFAGQGVVAETLNLSQLEGYHTGGTIHLIINNQIGFTTTPAEGRSTPYSTDVARMVQAPIFHVNGDDPEAAIHVMKLAFDFRQRFKKDVVIDMYCFRRHGHNEGDEPSYTQPLLYKQIKEHPAVYEIYSRKLIREKVITQDEVAAMRAACMECLNDAFDTAKSKGEPFKPEVITPLDSSAIPQSDKTAVSLEVLQKVTHALTNFPEGFQLHPKLASFIAKRKQMMEEGRGIDWSMAEALAFGTLAYEGTPVRLSGQDSSRGTFSQRHAVLADAVTGREYLPLNHLADGMVDEPVESQARVDVYDSLLSEMAVLGFEYGYSVADPSSLVMWEAQFGDFANGAQIIIDQFIAASEAKWQQPCDLVLLLPHGSEGQGPEHSNARPERFLQLCSEDNMRVCNCTTPAQYFHVLRRQMRDGLRKPLVLMTPKSLLRHPRVVSSIEEFTNGHFQEVIDDNAIADRAAVQRVLLCSGKIYYDLLQAREEKHLTHLAIGRIEQLYPYPKSHVVELLNHYPNVREVIWVQEEPRNMGAWRYIRGHLLGSISSHQKLDYIGRPHAASPATGSLTRHHEEQAKVVEEALGR